MPVPWNAPFRMQNNPLGDVPYNPDAHHPHPGSQGNTGGGLTDISHIHPDDDEMIPLDPGHYISLYPGGRRNFGARAPLPNHPGSHMLFPLINWLRGVPQFPHLRQNMPGTEPYDVPGHYPQLGDFMEGLPGLDPGSGGAVLPGAGRLPPLLGGEVAEGLYPGGSQSNFHTGVPGHMLSGTLRTGRAPVPRRRLVA